MTTSHTVTIIVAAICVLGASVGVVTQDSVQVHLEAGEAVNVYWTYLQEDTGVADISATGAYRVENLPKGCGEVVEGQIVGIPKYSATGRDPGVVIRAEEPVDLLLRLHRK